MAKYIFYTNEGFTVSPNNTKLKNFQILGFVNGKSLRIATLSLLKNNPWIAESGFNVEKLNHYKIINKQDENNLKSIVEYMWSDEQKHFEEYDDKKSINHIYHKLKKAKGLVS